MQFKLLTAFLLSLFFSTCSVKQTDTVHSKNENDSLASSKKTEPQVQIKNTRVHELTSSFTKTDYDIYVSYPVGYDTYNRKYPVLVVLDAEVNFGAVTYIVQRLIKDELIPKMFIVGIAYRGETDEDTYYALRGRDFTPTSDTARHYRFGNGGAEHFVKFISDELFLYLSSKYPIESNGKSLYGHSFGGLLGTHVLLNHPTLFDNYLILSPSLWWNNNAILQNVKLDASAVITEKKVYIGTGSLEGGMVGDQLKMVKTLNALSSQKIKIKSEILDHETHRTVFGRGFTNALRFIYAKK